MKLQVYSRKYVYLLQTIEIKPSKILGVKCPHWSWKKKDLIYKLSKVSDSFISSSKGKGLQFLPHQCQHWVVHPYCHHQILAVHLTRTWLWFQTRYLLRHCCLTPPLHPFPAWCPEPWMKWKTHEKIIKRRN